MNNVFDWSGKKLTCKVQQPIEQEPICNFCRWKNEDSDGTDCWHDADAPIDLIVECNQYLEPNSVA